DLGIEVDHVVTFAVSPDLNGSPRMRSRAFFSLLEEDLKAIPGVQAVSEALVPVLAGSSWGSDVSVQGFKRGPDIDANSRTNVVGPSFFKALGMPMVAGRQF